MPVLQRDRRGSIRAGFRIWSPLKLCQNYLETPSGLTI